MNNVKVCIILTYLFWLGLCGIVLINTLPQNPLSLKKVNSINLNSFLPTGWNFFTRNPREPLVHIYKKNEKGLWILDPASNNGSKINYYGLKRNARAMSSEYSLVFSNSNITWKIGNGSINNIPKDNLIIINNTLNEPMFCGDYLFLMKKPIPWLWAKNKSSEKWPYNYLLLKFNCNN